MRKIALAALLAVIAVPAWAGNDDRPAISSTNPVAFDVCVASGTPSAICVMKYTTDAEALDVAQRTLATCSKQTVGNPDECSVIRAYIKQRWGY